MNKENWDIFIVEPKKMEKRQWVLPIHVYPVIMPYRNYELHTV